MSTEAREFDVVLFGATGFTGRLVAAYLVQRMRAGEEHFRLALAARNADKLAEVARQIDAPGLTQIVADSFDADALSGLAKRTKVVISTVGPYAKYGEALVGACAKQGTHYCDLTGEVLFIRRMLDAHEESAKKSGARIVHCCGYDSIPSDLGTLFLQNEMKKRCDVYAERVVAAAGKSRGGFSGGTVASVLHIFKEVQKDPSIRALIDDAYGINPAGVRGPDVKDQLGVRHIKALPGWTAPFMMAGINTRVVRRSHALLGQPWGEDFVYEECMTLGTGLKGWLGAAMVASGLTAFMVLLILPLTRTWIAPMLPQPGEGPDQEARESGYFNHHLVGQSGDSRLEVLVTAQGDPGYASTSRMLAESGLCLALQADQLPSAGGILTPASAMGDVLIERLRGAEIRFEVVV